MSKQLSFESQNSFRSSRETVFVRVAKQFSFESQNSFPSSHTKKVSSLVVGVSQKKFSFKAKQFLFKQVRVAKQFSFRKIGPSLLIIYGPLTSRIISKKQLMSRF